MGFFIFLGWTKSLPLFSAVTLIIAGAVEHTGLGSHRLQVEMTVSRRSETCERSPSRVIKVVATASRKPPSSRCRGIHMDMELILGVHCCLSFERDELRYWNTPAGYYYRQSISVPNIMCNPQNSLYRYCRIQDVEKFIFSDGTIIKTHTTCMLPPPCFTALRYCEVG